MQYPIAVLKNARHPSAARLLVNWYLSQEGQSHLVKLRGVNVFPSQIESALMAVEGALPHYQIILTRQKDLDQIEVRVEVTPDVLTTAKGLCGSIGVCTKFAPIG